MSGTTPLGTQSDHARRDRRNSRRSAATVVASRSSTGHGGRNASSDAAAPVCTGAAGIVGVALTLAGVVRTCAGPPLVGPAGVREPAPARPDIDGLPPPVPLGGGEVTVGDEVDGVGPTLNRTEPEVVPRTPKSASYVTV